MAELVSGQRRPVEAARSVVGIDALQPELGPLFVAVGVFDGLHRGHLYLLRQLRLAARRHAARPAVVTFDAHPDEVIRGAAPPLLCDPDERLVRLAAAGVEVTVVQHFDEALRRTTYDEFVARIRDRTALRGILMTPDAAFGYERAGTPEALAELGRAWGFEVVVVPPLLVEGRQVRSSEIRREVGAGDLAAARRLLGRSLSIVGTRRPDGAAEDRRSARLTFPVPVALPPAGRYRVAVGPAWRPGEEPLSVAVDAVATLGDEREPGAGLGLDAADGLPPGDRLRVVLERRLRSVRGSPSKVA
ncbi:MAG TPA: FAD synthetase family protein [Candidatus Limnocylindrales bacterium]